MINFALEFFLALTLFIPTYIILLDAKQKQLSDRYNMIVCTMVDERRLQT